MELPRMFSLRQHFPASPPLDLSTCLRAQLAAKLETIQPGARVAVCLGSRGIHQIDLVATEVVRALLAAGADPFVVPAMGSHGGATSEGQMSLLAGYGLTPETLGIPFVPSMDALQIGTTPEGVPVFCSCEALKADHVVVINRVKPHTDFHGTLGSGLLKMLVVGLGKQAGATAFHAAAFRSGYQNTLLSMAKVVLQRLPLLAGIALLENQRHRLHSLAVVGAANLLERETDLRREAAELAPSLPFREMDLLVVDQMGKNISGTGMDPAVIGRCIHGYSLREDLPHPKPWVRRLLVRRLTPESNGNAIGIGMADFTTEHLLRSINWQITRLNSLTALSLQGAKSPLSFHSDREAIEAAIGTLGLSDPSTARIVRIQNTLSLEHLQASESYAAEVATRPDLEVLDPPQGMTFDNDGGLR